MSKYQKKGTSRKSKPYPKLNEDLAFIEDEMEAFWVKMTGWIGAECVEECLKVRNYEAFKAYCEKHEIQVTF